MSLLSSFAVSFEIVDNAYHRDVSRVEAHVYPITFIARYSTSPTLRRSQTTVPLAFCMGSPQATSRVTDRVRKRLFDALSWSRPGSPHWPRARHRVTAVALAHLPTCDRFTRPQRQHLECLSPEHCSIPLVRGILIRFWACRRTGDFERDIFFSCRQPLAISGGIILFWVASLAKRP